MKVGVIGLGAMGHGIAINIAKAGLLTAVYNRTADKARQFSKQWHVESCATIEQLVQQLDCVLICISTDKDVLQVVNQLAQHLSPQSIVIDLSTVSNETAQQAAAILSKRQVAFLDAPVSGGVEGAQQGTLSIMVGGDITILDQVRFVLDIIGQNITHMGDVGTGQSTKAVNQIMAAGINQAVTDALAFAQQQGLPMSDVIKVVSGGAAGNWFLQHRGESMTNQSFSAGFKCHLHHKDLLICQKMAIKNNQTLSSIEKTLVDYQQLMELGYGDEDISALYRLKSR